MKEKLQNKIIEIYGEPDCGKSKFAFSLLDENDLTLYIDVDRKVHEINKNKNTTFLYHPLNIEELHNTLNNMIEYFDVIILDSLPTFSMNNNGIKSNSDKQVFTILKKIIKLCKKQEVTLIIVNQLRQDIKNNYTYGLQNLYSFYSIRICIENRMPNVVYYLLSDEEKMDLLFK